MLPGHEPTLSDSQQMCAIMSSSRGWLLADSRSLTLPPPQCSITIHSEPLLR